VPLARARHRPGTRSNRPRDCPPPLPTLPSRARWQALLTQARLALETVRDEMQTYDEDRSEAWQQGERAATLAAQIDHLEVVLNELEALPPCEAPNPDCNQHACGHAPGARAVGVPLQEVSSAGQATVPVSACPPIDRHA
jgi:hypothetical protein